MHSTPPPTPPPDNIVQFPIVRTLRWRRELTECHTYAETIGLVFRIIREVESEGTQRREGE